MLNFNGFILPCGISIIVIFLFNSFFTVEKIDICIEDNTIKK